MSSLLLLALLTVGSESSSKGTVLVFLTGDHCPTCRQMEPTVNKLVLEGLPIVIVKVKTQAELEKWGAQVVPTTLRRTNGKVTDKRQGLLTEAILRKMLADK